jgi:hypothetical protein
LSAKPGQHHFDFVPIPRAKDSSERPERFEIGLIEASWGIDSNVIDSPVLIFVSREVVRVLVPFERSPINVFACDGFGVRGIDPIANKRPPHLLGEWERI